MQDTECSDCAQAFQQRGQNESVCCDPISQRALSAQVVFGLHCCCKDSRNFITYALIMAACTYSISQVYTIRSQCPSTTMDRKAEADWLDWQSAIGCLRQRQAIVSIGESEHASHTLL